MRNFIPKSHFLEGERTDGGGERGEGVGEEDRYPKPARFATPVSRTHSRLSTSLLKTAMPHRMADDGNDGDGDDGFSEFKQGRQGTRE